MALRSAVRVLSKKVAAATAVQVGRFRTAKYGERAAKHATKYTTLGLFIGR